MVYVLSYTVQSPILQKPCKHVAVLISRCASDLGYPNLHLTSIATTHLGRTKACSQHPVRSTSYVTWFVIPGLQIILQHEGTGGLLGTFHHPMHPLNAEHSLCVRLIGYTRCPSTPGHRNCSKMIHSLTSKE
jgi:hypothetical protein